VVAAQGDLGALGCERLPHSTYRQISYAQTRPSPAGVGKVKVSRAAKEAIVVVASSRAARRRPTQPTARAWARRTRRPPMRPRATPCSIHVATVQPRRCSDDGWHPLVIPPNQ